MGSLSDDIKLINIERGDRYHPMLDVEKVKKSIKKVKKEIQEEIDAVPHIANINEVHKLHITERLENIKKEIDKIFGPKLTGGKG